MKSPFCPVTFRKFYFVINASLRFAPAQLGQNRYHRCFPRRPENSISPTPDTSHSDPPGSQAISKHRGLQL